MTERLRPEPNREGVLLRSKGKLKRLGVDIGRINDQLTGGSLAAAIIIGGVIKDSLLKPKTEDPTHKGPRSSDW